MNFKKPFWMTEDVKLNFSEDSLFVLNACLALIMFGVALHLKWSNLRYVLHRPLSFLAGVISQYLFLPALTGLLIWLLEPGTGIAMGMVLLAACPGGNVSNFFALIGRGNIELSVALTTVSSLASAFTTPLLFLMWSGLIFANNEAVSIELPFMPTLITIGGVIVLPATAGMLISARFPRFADKLQKPMQNLGMVVLIAFIVFALRGNWQAFANHIGSIFWLIAAHHFLAAVGSYGLASLLKRPHADRVSISLETSIQNTALGLVITFNFFDGNGPMAFVLAWWGVWHLIGGYAMARMFRSKQMPQRAL